MSSPLNWDAINDRSIYSRDRYFINPTTVCPTVLPLWSTINEIDPSRPYTHISRDRMAANKTEIFAVWFVRMIFASNKIWRRITEITNVCIWFRYKPEITIELDHSSFARRFFIRTSFLVFSFFFFFSLSLPSISRYLVVIIIHHYCFWFSVNL